MICEMCGEEIELLTCPYCLTTQAEGPPQMVQKKAKLKVINIKEDLPTAETAIDRLRAEICHAVKQGHKALKVIHGYGSSGRGGVIKQEVHRYLRSHEDVNYWFPGEEFSAAYEETLEIIKQYPFLESDEDFRRGNRGISILIF
jgi:hypothetical protein